jgi:hypothetical protein
MVKRDTKDIEAFPAKEVAAWTFHETRRMTHLKTISENRFLLVYNGVLSLERDNCNNAICLCLVRANNEESKQQC